MKLFLFLALIGSTILVTVFATAKHSYSPMDNYVNAVVKEYDGSTRHANEVVEQITDDRGLTSVVFRQDSQEWGLDYLTRVEYDSLVKVLNHN